MSLSDETTELKTIIDQLKNRYLSHEKPENRRDHDFFMYVREQTTPIYELVQKWEKAALEFVKKREVRVHPQQVASTKENIELLLMHSYYIDTPKKRYMELNQSVHYVMDSLLDDMNKY